MRLYERKTRTRASATQHDHTYPHRRLYWEEGRGVLCMYCGACAKAIPPELVSQSMWVNRPLVAPNRNHHQHRPTTSHTGRGRVPPV